MVHLDKPNAKAASKYAEFEVVPALACNHAVFCKPYALPLSPPLAPKDHYASAALLLQMVARGRLTGLRNAAGALPTTASRQLWS